MFSDVEKLGRLYGQSLKISKLLHGSFLSYDPIGFGLNSDIAKVLSPGFTIYDYYYKFFKLFFCLITLFLCIYVVFRPI